MQLLCPGAAPGAGRLPTSSWAFRGSRGRQWWGRPGPITKASFSICLRYKRPQSFHLCVPLLITVSVEIYGYTGCEFGPQFKPELNHTFNKAKYRAASCRGARELSENVRSIFINILPSHLAPVTWLSVSGSCGVQSECIN